MKDNGLNNTQKTLMWFLLTTGFFLSMTSSCSDTRVKYDYKTFPGNEWARFNILEYNIPVGGGNNTYDVLFYAWFTRDFEYDSLPFNMVMVTPSGEERIMEYTIDVKPAMNELLQQKDKDSCMESIPLQKELSIRKNGMLKISIENLNPRLTTKGIKGAGVKVKKSGKKV